MAEHTAMQTTLVPPTDEVGEITWRLPQSVERAIADWPTDKREELYASLRLLMSMHGHLLCGEVSYAARTGTEPMQDLARSMMLFGKFQGARAAATFPDPSTKRH